MYNSVLFKSQSKKFLLNQYSSPDFITTEYDPLDRPLVITDQDGNNSIFAYNIEEDVNNEIAFKTSSTIDQINSQKIKTEIYKDVSNRTISSKNNGGINGAIWTTFQYNGIGELISYTDAEGLSTTYNYDSFGRKTEVIHPDNGISIFNYDNVNLISTLTSNLQNLGQSINYNYEINRLTSIEYPQLPSGDVNLANVTYTYGGNGNETGRLIEQQDATGTQSFEYGNMGEITNNTRVVVGPNIPTRIFTTSFAYDSWNRLQSMTYPDGEELSYNYDLGGNLTKITGSYNSAPYVYVKQISYDYYEQKTHLRYGNNTETFYNYTPSLRRLNNLQVKSASNTHIYNNDYNYDQVGNVVGISNTAGINGNEMAGNYQHTFQYDNLNRLGFAEGSFTGSDGQPDRGNDANASYSLSMGYNDTHSIAIKQQFHTKNGNTFKENTYTNNYTYHPNTHRIEAITNTDNGDVENYIYDLNGNMTMRTTNSGNQRDLFWDESNRLRVVADNQTSMQHYIYDAAGERILKANSDMESVFENGSLISGPGTVSINGYTSYPSAFMVISADGIFSKHYYAGTQRIVSRLGDTDASIFDIGNNKSKTSNSPILDYQKLQQAQKQSLNQISEQLKRGLVQFKPFQASPLKETLQAYAAMDEDTLTAQKTTVANPIYYYHPDHLGTSTALTDASGEPYQFFLNLPFGETMAEQLGSQYYNTPYKFNGKELDEETGLYYYGARYYDPRVSNWLSVDPLAHEYPNVSPYLYVLNNPINAIDPDGRRVFFVGGAGNDPISQGWNYMNRWKSAFTNSNINGFTRLDVSRGKNADAMFTKSYRNSGYEVYNGGVNTSKHIAGLAPAQEWTTRPVQNDVIDNAVNQIRNNLSDNPLAEGEQLNLGGYSYGSVVQAQAALNLANDGTFVDNLILIGSPISSDSDLYKQLSSNKNIGNIIRFDIKGDNLSNPSSFGQYLKGGVETIIKGDAAPHFDLARPGSNIDKAIQGVTDWLKSKGVD